MTLADRIEIDPAVMMGKPVLAGTRIPLELVLRKLSEGASDADLLDQYPAVTERSLRLARELLETFQRFDVARSSIFGSALRPEFRPDSDIDLLVEFQPAARVGLLALSRLRTSLEGLLGRNVDIVPASGLKDSLRRGIEESARILYAA